MPTKNEYTIEELEAQYKLAEEKRNSLKQQIEQKKEGRRGSKTGPACASKGCPQKGSR